MTEHTYRNLGGVKKPYQYIGHEENTYNKDFDQAELRTCIAFPDAYEIGMSNVGMQIIYYVINEHPDFMADRVYAPLVDMGDMLRNTDQELRARESGRALRAFDLIGFTLQYELCYTNLLYMLDLAKIPRRAADRGEDVPFITAGGPCAFNPEPVADFFDFIIVGEGEEVSIEVCEVLRNAKRHGLNRRNTLMSLAQVKGVYVPSLYEPIYDGDRFIKLERKTGAPRWVERRIIKDLDTAPYPTTPVTPSITPIHERVSVEIQRGCTRSCRFCQAGYIYRPRRERTPQKIYDIIEKSVEATGINDIGLLSLSSADYSHIHPLMKAVMERYRKDHLSVSLPSTRLEALKEEYLDVLKEERRSGFTIAPEAGSQRLREVINKNFTEEEVVETARMLFRNGWKSVKMYFMIGQPTETDEDVRAIAELGNTVIRKTSDIPGRKTVTISVSNFVPKPHTPFQWHEQISHEEILRKQQIIRESLQFRQLQFRCHNADNSFAEGLLARSDRRYSHLIERVVDLGARFDCWQDRFDINIWRMALDELQTETGMDFAHEALRSREMDERMPWHRIYSGLHPKFFKNEYNKAVHGVATEDCSFDACHECGLCNEKTDVAPIVCQGETVTARAKADDIEAMMGPTRRFRFQYCKDGAGVYLSTLDIQSMIVRAFARAQIPVTYSNGMRTRAKIAMGPPVPLGVASRCELFDIFLDTILDEDVIIERVNRFLPEHARLLTGTEVEKDGAPITSTIGSVSYILSWEELARFDVDREQAIKGVNKINAAEKYLITRIRGGKNGRERRSVINLKESLLKLAPMEEGIAFTMDAPGGQAPSPYAVLEALTGEQVTKTEVVNIRKTGFNLKRSGDSLEERRASLNARRLEAAPCQI